MIWGSSSWGNSRGVGANLSSADQRLVDQVINTVMPQVKGDDKDRLQVLVDGVYAGTRNAVADLRKEARLQGFRV